jgi:glucans biosynthesis protein C
MLAGQTTCPSFARPHPQAFSDHVSRSRDVALDYLKATLVLMVVAHHSCLAYATFAHFDPARYLAGQPIVDPSRWRFFDYAENFNDVFFMSLMFFVSGLFVWPALRRAGAVAFIRGRLLRLGAPFAAGVVLLMPLAYYASWQLTGHDAGYLAYWRRNITTDRWPSGPLWFIWLLLLFDILAAGCFIAWPRGIGAAPLGWARRKPLVAAAAMFGVCAAVYLPALRTFGFGAWGAFLFPAAVFPTEPFRSVSGLVRRRRLAWT